LGVAHESKPNNRRKPAFEREAPITGQGFTIGIGRQSRALSYSYDADTDRWPADARSRTTLNEGWLAFTKNDIAGASQVWTRSPTGTLRQVSIFGSSSTIDAIGSDGSMVFFNGGSRYYAPT
jgi:hypothetical protein